MASTIHVKIKRLDKDLPLPSYGYEGDAAFDLFTREEVELSPGERYAVPTGVALEIPDGFVGLVWDKSGIGIKSGLKTLGGVVDSTYRGEVFVGVVNLSQETYIFERGDKVAQMMIQKKESVQIEEVSELSDTDRGDGAFGSTGK